MTDTLTEILEKVIMDSQSRGRGGLGFIKNQLGEEAKTADPEVAKQIQSLLDDPEKFQKVMEVNGRQLYSRLAGMMHTGPNAEKEHQNDEANFRKQFEAVLEKEGITNSVGTKKAEKGDVPMGTPPDVGSNIPGFAEQTEATGKWHREGSPTKDVSVVEWAFVQGVVNQLARDDGKLSEQDVKGIESLRKSLETNRDKYMDNVHEEDLGELSKTSGIPEKLLQGVLKTTPYR